MRTGSQESPTGDVQDLVDRYVAVWNETDATARRERLMALWPPEGVHYVRTLEARGYAALEQRIASSHEKNVVIAGHRFRSADVQRLRDVVTFHWEMIAPSGEIAAVGLEFLVLDGSGRILADYQFIVS